MVLAPLSCKPFNDFIICHVMDMLYSHCLFCFQIFATVFTVVNILVHMSLCTGAFIAVGVRCGVAESREYILLFF